MSEVTIRRSTLDDLEAHVEHRVGMFRDMDWGDDERRTRMAAEFREYLRESLSSGASIGWVAEHEGAVIGGVLIQLKEALPSPLTPNRARGYLYNMYVAPEARRQGVARRLTQAAVDHAREIGLQILELHASRFGRGLYVSMGFRPAPEFRLVLSDEVAQPASWREDG